MARFTRRQITTVLSIVYLAGLTILGAYALRSSHLYSLPISDLVPALAVALPPCAGVAMSLVINLNDSLAAKGQLQTSRIFQVVMTVIIVWEAVEATLAGIHLSPEASLTCALEERWVGMFSAKDEVAIRRIQDAFNCCGFQSSKDMAWPFPDRDHDVDTCLKRFERNSSCMGPWKMEERKVAIMLLVVAVATFVWQIAMILSPSSGSSWLPSGVRLPIEDAETSGSHRRRIIEYRDADGGGDDESVRAEVERLNKDSNLASQVEAERTRSVGLWREHENWRDTADRA